ncbi:hypothetical protein HMPREF3213_02238 [Heyndrickxia coagulans]|uniref:Uncharacterized protein n=1 Tax=Heyndrickxia coagulans TaxID=1398 RepID=A0A133KMG7_HEYCO|nr:hypothetical protein HMPREF3213_02238 [Heyndrickxia coagulans]
MGGKRGGVQGIDLEIKSNAFLFFLLCKLVLNDRQINLLQKQLLPQ